MLVFLFQCTISTNTENTSIMLKKLNVKLVFLVTIKLVQLNFNSLKGYKKNVLPEKTLNISISLIVFCATDSGVWYFCESHLVILPVLPYLTGRVIRYNFDLGYMCF